MLRSFVSFLNCLSLGHVFSLFRRAVETGAFLMINMALGIHPYQAMTAACRRGSISLGGAGGGLRCRTSRRFRFE